jgi:hypothetical protein
MGSTRTGDSSFEAGFPSSDRVLAATAGDNLLAYSYMFAIEVGLRELIIERLGALAGRQWYKTRLPADVLQKYREGRAKENGIPWTNFVHHDPLYYTDFASLSKVMDRGSNWSEAFQSLFGTKDVFLGSLKSLEEIRNKVAHNRKVTQRDLSLLRHTYSLLVAALGENHLSVLVGRCSNASGAADTISALREEVGRCASACLNFRPLPPVEFWEEVRNTSWLGMLSIDVDFDIVEEFFRVMDEYRTLPSSWPGYKIERWVKSNRVGELHRKADDLLVKMLSDATNE